MTDQPPFYETAEQLLSRAQELFDQADQELRRGLGRNVDQDHMSRLYRANLLFTGASAGARIAQAMNGAAHLDMLREFEERAEVRTQNLDAAMQGLADEPLTDGEYLRSLEAWRDLVLEFLRPIGHPNSDAYPGWRRQARAAVLTAPRRADDGSPVSDTGRAPYDPPTLTGPYDPDREHGR